MRYGLMRTKNLNKGLIAVLLICLIALPVWAGDVVASGYGKTIEEAKQNALSELMKTVFPVLVTGETTVSMTQSTQSFSSQSGSTAYGLLYSVEYEEFRLSSAEAKTERYGYHAILRDNVPTVSWYEKKAEEAKKDAESFYLMYTSADSSALERRRDLLIEVLGAYTEYENFQYVLLKLGHRIPDLDLGKTKNVIQYEYENVLIEISNYLMSDKSYDIELKAQGIMSLLEQNVQDMEQLAESKAESLRQQELLNQAAIQEQMDRIRSTINGTGKVYSDYKTLDYFDTMFGDLLSAISEFNTAGSRYDEMVAAENDRIDKAIEEEAEAIRNRAYRTAQLSNGVPIADAKNEREKEVSQMKSEREEERSRILQFIDSQMQPLIQDAYDRIASLVTQIEESAFVAKVSDGSLVVESVRYDGKDYSWKFTLTSTFFNRGRFQQYNKATSMFTVNLSLPYSKVTGDSAKPDVSSSAYLDRVDAYQSLLKSMDYWKGSNDIVLDLSVHLTAGSFDVSVKAMRMALNGSDFEVRPESSKKFTVKYPDLSIRSVSGYKWLKTSRALSGLTSSKSAASSGYVSDTASSQNSSNLPYYVRNLTDPIHIKAFGGAGFGTEEDDWNIIAGAEVYKQFGSFGVGLSPFVRTANDYGLLCGVDLMLIFNPFLMNSELKSYYESGYNEDFDSFIDFKIGVGKAGLDIKAELVFEFFQKYSLTIGLISNYTFGLQFTLLAGYKFR